MRAAAVRAALAGALVLAAAVAAAAETVRVRSGEHGRFTRLVLVLERPAAWRLEGAGAEWRLRLDRPDLRLDLSEVFRRIPRRRLARAEAAGPELRLGLACACPVTAFEDRPGVVVIDIAAGPEEVAPGGAAPRPRPRPAPPPDRTAPQPGLAAAAAAALPVDPFLDLYWRGLGPASGGPGEDPAGRSTTGPAAGAPGGPAPETARETPEQRRDGVRADATSLAPAAPAPPPDDAARSLLQSQIARAASQGLVEPLPVAPPHATGTPFPPPAGDGGGAAPSIGPGADRGTPSATGGATGSAAGSAATITADASSGDGSAAGAAAGSGGGPRRLRDALHAETAIDRARRGTSRLVLTEEAADCPAEALVDLPAWGDGSDPADQIARARADLVGEFDRPDPAAVLRLARLYLHLGLGAEARATLAAFGLEGPEARAAAALSPLVDGETEPSGPFAGLAGCPSAVALWAVLSQPELPRGASGPAAGAAVAVGDVVRAFAALPPPLRRHLGPGLAARFLAAGDAETARALRDAAERAPGLPASGVELMTARLALARGAVAEAERTLAALAAGSGPDAAEALALLLEARLARGAAADQAAVETAAALARELEGTPLGDRLAAAHARAEAARGAFDAAFRALDDYARRAPSVAASVADDLFLALAAQGSDGELLRHGFPGAAPRGRPGPAGRPARRALAERLLALGFGAAAAAVLGPPSGLGAEDRLLAARAALADDDPRRALLLLEGLPEAAAAALRGDALTRLGDHRSAAAAYARAGASGASAAAAARWRATDWAAAARGAPVGAPLPAASAEPPADAPRDAPTGSPAGPPAGSPAAPLEPLPLASAHASPPHPPAPADDRLRLVATLLGRAPGPLPAAPPAGPAAPAGATATDAPRPVAPPGADAAPGPLGQARALLDASRAGREAAAALLALHPPP